MSALSGSRRKRPLVTYSKRARSVGARAVLEGTPTTQTVLTKDSSTRETSAAKANNDDYDESRSGSVRRPKRKLARMLFGDSIPSKDSSLVAESESENISSAGTVETPDTPDSGEKKSAGETTDHHVNERPIENPSTPTKIKRSSLNDETDHEDSFCITPRDSPLALTPQTLQSPSPRRRKLKDQLIAKVENTSNTNESPSRMKSSLSPLRNSQPSPKPPEAASPSSMARKSGAPSSCIRPVVTYSRTRSFLASSLSDKINSPLIPAAAGSSSSSESEDEGTHKIDNKPAKVQGFYELRRSGQNSRIIDELEYILEGLSSKDTSSRRAGYLAIAGKMCDHDFVQRFRSSSFPSRIFSVFPASDDIISKFAFLFSAYIFAKDGPSSSATSLVIDYEILTTLSSITETDKIPIFEVYNDQNIKLSKICRKEVGDLMKKISDSEDLKICGKRNQKKTSVVRIAMALLLVLTEKCDKDICMTSFESFFRLSGSDWLFAMASSTVCSLERIISEQDTQNAVTESSQAGIEYFMIITIFEYVLEASVNATGSEDVSWVRKDGFLKTVGSSLQSWLKLHQRYLDQGQIDGLEIVDYSNVALRVLILATTADPEACADLGNGDFVKTLVEIILNEISADDESSQSRTLYALGLMINMTEVKTSRKAIIDNIEPMLSSFRKWCRPYVEKSDSNQSKFNYLDDRAEYMGYAIGSIFAQQQTPLKESAWTQDDISLVLSSVRNFSRRLKLKQGNQQEQEGPIKGQSGLTAQLATLEEKLSGAN